MGFVGFVGCNVRAEIRNQLRALVYLIDSSEVDQEGQSDIVAASDDEMFSIADESGIE